MLQRILYYIIYRSTLLRDRDEIWKDGVERRRKDRGRSQTGTEKSERSNMQAKATGTKGTSHTKDHKKPRKGPGNHSLPGPGFA